MATQIQLRGGTTSEHSTFTGAVREVTVDTDKDTVVVHDGGTAGGIPLAKEASVLPLAGGTMTGDVSLGDGVKAKFGAGDDLQIYHDGSNSYVDDVGDGDLILKGSSKVKILASNSETMASFSKNGAASLFFDSGTYTAAKLATTSTGIDVTGTVTADGLYVDGNATVAGNLSLGANDTYVGFPSNGIYYNNSADHISVKTAAKLRQKIDVNGDISFYEDTGTTPKFFWDASAESLGIGTSSPVSELDVRGGVTVDSFSGNGYRILRSGLSLPVMEFGVSATDVLSVINPVNSPLVLGTNSTERMRIDSSGNVGIGTTSPTGGNSILTLENVNGSGTQINFKNATTTSGYVGLSGDANGDLIHYLGDSADHIFYTSGSERIRITDSGLTFNGDTAAANALDDYETGTWTPSLASNSGTSPTIIYGEQSGTYVKVGKLVTITANLTISSFTAATNGIANINGLPFAWDSGQQSAGSIVANKITFGRPPHYGLTLLSTNTLGFLSSGNGGAWNWEAVGIFETGSNLRISFSYFAA